MVSLSHKSKRSFGIREFHNTISSVLDSVSQNRSIRSDIITPVSQAIYNDGSFTEIPRYPCPIYHYKPINDSFTANRVFHIGIKWLEMNLNVKNIFFS